MQVTGINTAVNFQRKPTKKEEVELKTTINKAYELIGAKERVVITHGSCFPSGYKNTGIGSPYSKTANEYIKFLSLYGFNGIQLGPVGLLEKGTNSPYKSSAFAKNRLFIDLEKLTTKDYDSILSTKTYQKVTTTPLLSKNNYTMSDFKKANKTYNIALKEAYNNFQNNIAIGKSQELKSEYNKFQKLLEKGNINICNEEYYEAERVLLEMKKLYPEDYTCYMQLAYVYIEMENQKDQDLRDYSAAVENYELAKRYVGSESSTDFAMLENAIEDLKEKGWI